MRSWWQQIHGILLKALPMSGLDALLGLPEILSCALLSQWIDIEHLRKVDTAYCHGAKRKTLFDLYQSEQLLLSNASHRRMEDKMPSNYLAWCVARNLKFSEFFLTVDLTYSHKHDEAVKFLALSSNTLHTFDCYANYCPKLWLKALAKHTKQLRVLYLSSFHFNGDQASELAEVLANNQHSLTDLTLKAGSIELSGAVYSFPQLLKLELSFEADTQGLSEAILSGAPCLQHLTLHAHERNTGTPVSVLRALHGQPRQLQTITVHDLDSQSALILPDVCPVGPALALHFANRVSSPAFRRCVNNCANIQLINTQCGEHLQALMGNANSLQDLRLRRPSGTDEIPDLAGIIAQCTVLTDLSLLHIPQLSAVEIVQIVRAVPIDLRVLTLCGVEVDDSILRAVSRRLTHLKGLHIINDENYPENSSSVFTEDGLFHLAQYCVHLTQLDLGRDPESVLSPMSLYLWRKLCPQLNIYDNHEAYYEEFDVEDDMDDVVW